MPPTSSVDFGSFAAQWLATVGVVRLKPSAYREYESVIRRHLVPAFEGLALSAITAEVIQGYVAERIAGGLAPRSVDNHVIVLKAVLGTAVEYGLLSENAVNLVARPRVERNEMQFLTPHEVRRLLDATPEAWRLLLALPALCGLRKGEALALVGDDARLDDMTLSVTKSMRAGVVSTPKTRASIGLVPIPQSLSSLIAQRRTSGPALLFSKGNDGRTPLSDSTPNRILARSLAAAGLPAIRYHDLRHSWAVAHLRAGTDLKTLTALGRWSSPMTLLQVYAHVIPTIGGEAVKRLDEFVHDSLNQ